MRALEVSVNGLRVCLAGVGDEGVLNAIVSAGSKRSVELPMRLSVVGLANDEHLRWLEGEHGFHHLQVGDEIGVRIVEAEDVDPPRIRKRRDPESCGR